MVVDSQEELQRRRLDGFWRVGHLETGVRTNPKRHTGDHRAGVHDPVRKSGGPLHPVRARLTLAYIVLNVGAVGGILAILIQGRPG